MRDMSVVLEPPQTLHRFSRRQYDRMIDAGVFGPEDRIELLNGEIIDMAPQRSRHATAIRLIEKGLNRIFAAGHDVRTQLPLCLDDRSEPEPDVAVVSGNPRDYRDAHPETALLVVEVSETSLAYDRIRKLAVYARARIPEYWILDLNSETLEVCRHPERDTYTERRILKAADRLAPLAAPGQSVTVSDLLP